MKRALAHSALILVACFITVGAKGQQVYQFSQYLQNLYILNSATAGLHDYTEVNLSYRNQWVGITNSPTTYYVSVTQPLGKRIEINPQNSSVRISSPAAYTSIQRKSYHAVGGYAAQDSYGPYGLTMAGLSYTFHLPIAKQLSVAFSPSVGYTSVTFDQSKAVVEFSGDPTYMNYVSSRGASSLMDINLAFWMYHPKFFVGYSSDQLVQDRPQAIESDYTRRNQGSPQFDGRISLPHQPKHDLNTEYISEVRKPSPHLCRLERSA